MNDLLVDRLERHLTHLAEATELHTTPVATLQQRASARQRRRRALTAGLVIAVIGTAGVVAARHRGTPQPTQTPVVSEVTSTTPPTTESPVPTTTPPSTVSPDAGPTVIEPLQVLDVGAAGFEAATPDDWSQGTFPFLGAAMYADTATLSWIGDRFDHTHTSSVVRSLDGVNWQPIATAPGIEVIGGTDDGDDIALVGYLPKGVPGGGDLVLTRSSDGGVTWTQLPIGETLAAEWASDIFVNVVPSAVAIHDGTVVFTVNASATLDWSTLLPQDALDASFTLLPEGVGVYEPCAEDETCVGQDTPITYPSRAIDHIIPWADLGIAPASATKLLGLASLYVADAGGVRAVDPAQVLNIGAVTSLTSTDDGFLVGAERPPIDNSPSPTTVLRSTDGVIWTAIAEAPIQQGIVTEVDGRVAAVGFATDLSGQITLVVQTGSGSWNRLDIDDLMSAAAGTWQLMFQTYHLDQHGITAGAESVSDPVADAGGASVSRDGVTATWLDGAFQSMRVVDDQTGAVIGVYADNEWTGPVSSESGEIVVRDSQGRVRTRFTIEDGMFAINSVPRPPANRIILHSEDLLHWSVTSIADAVDLPVSKIDSVGSIDGRPVLRMGIDTSLAPEAPPYVVLAGTPKV